MIGEWIARMDGDVIFGRTHYAESEVADRVITHCGREMHRTTAKGTLELVPVGPFVDAICRGCRPMFALSNG